MELWNFGKYECKNFMNYFSGGTAYDTTVLLENTANNYDLFVTTVPNESEKELQADLITHFDDDRFNNHVTDSNVVYQADSEIIDGFVRANRCMNPQHFFTSQINVDNVSNLIRLNADSFEDGIYQIGENLNDSFYFNNISSDSGNGSFSTDILAAQEEEEISSQASSLPSTISDWNTSSDYSCQENSELNSNPSVIAGSVLKSRIRRKRKQSYAIKDDIFLEMPKEDYEEPSKVAVSNKYIKKEMLYDKENKKQIYLYENEKPFRQTKMKSILKNSGSNCNDYFYNNSSYNDNTKNNIVNFPIFENSVCSNGTSFGLSSHINLSANVYNDNPSEKSEINSLAVSPFHLLDISNEFTKPNYFNYVHSIEKIEIDNIDKLISPTIEIDLSGAFEASSIFQDQNKKLFSHETAEKILFSKSFLAKEFGFPNYFNTSNESVIEELLYDESPAYKRIQLDLSFRMGTRSMEFYPSYQTFKPLSLFDSFNEFKRFGIIAKENNMVEAENNIINLLPTSELTEIYKDNSYKKEPFKNNSSYIFKSNIFEIDSDLSSEETVTSSETENNIFSTPIKIRIKRITSNKRNKYVIADSVKPTTHGSRKCFPNYSQNFERYNCADCSKKFRTKKLLLRHISAYHKGPYDIECNICHMKSKRSSAHKQHLPFCENYKKFKCRLCSKEYCYKASLTKHLKSHEIS